ncbi:MAG TPA: hypothetical protein VII48_09590, partial [Rhizomicrobium sp.]
MLKPHGTHESLAGKLLLSSALVAVSLAYGWWQRENTQGPHVTMATAAPVPVVHAPVPQASAPPPVTASAAPAVPTATPVPDTSVAALPRSVAPAASKSATIAPLQVTAPVAAPQAPPQQEAAITLLPPAQPLPTVPSNDVSPPLPAATGAPASGVMPAIPAGSHLLDGDFVSDRHQLEWGDLRVKISVRGGVITGVQILQYPDHRSHSLDLSEMAGPILESEVIKVQKAQVDAVSSATDLSYAFQDVIAD